MLLLCCMCLCRHMQVKGVGCHSHHGLVVLVICCCYYGRVLFVATQILQHPDTLILENLQPNAHPILKLLLCHR